MPPTARFSWSGVSKQRVWRFSASFFRFIYFPSNSPSSIGWCLVAELQVNHSKIYLRSGLALGNEGSARGKLISCSGDSWVCARARRRAWTEEAAVQNERDLAVDERLQLRTGLRARRDVPQVEMVVV